MKVTRSIQHVSDTAFWMASYRATESERKDALFRDPLAKILVGEHGERISNSMASMARNAYWTLVVRTCLIDDYLKKYIKEGYTTVINLGSGLDTRPYRLDLPDAVQWIEVDFQGIIELKNESLKNEKPTCQLERVAVDLSNRAERKKIFKDLNSRIGPALILTEGVIPYLPEAVVRDLAKDLREYSNFKLWIAEYYSPKLYPHFQAKGFRKLLGDSPFQFFPADWFSFFESCGWVKKEIQYLYDEGERLGRRFPLPGLARILQLVVGQEVIAENARLQAYLVFRPGEMGVIGSGV